MKFKTIRRLFKEALENLVKNRLVATVAISTVFISLTIFSIFYFVVNVVNVNITNMQGQIEIVAFLEDDLEESDIDALQAEIESVDNVKSVQYISSEEGLNEYKESLANDEDEEMINIVEKAVTEEENPIPATFSIKTLDSTKNNDVKDSVSSFEEIYKISDSNVITNFLNKFGENTKIVASILMVVLLLASILLISNSIKVAVFIRKKEISIIKYIGATNNYIRLPFIIEGFLIGTIGAVLSIGAMVLLYNTTTPRILVAAKELISGFTIPELGPILIPLVPILLIIGAGIGVVGSLVSIRKYLKV